MGPGSALGAWGGCRAVPGLRGTRKGVRTALLCLPPWQGLGVSLPLRPDGCCRPGDRYGVGLLISYWAAAALLSCPRSPCPALGAALSPRCKLSVACGSTGASSRPLAGTQAVGVGRAVLAVDVPAGHRRIPLRGSPLSWCVPQVQRFLEAAGQAPDLVERYCGLYQRLRGATEELFGQQAAFVLALGQGFAGALLQLSFLTALHVSRGSVAAGEAALAHGLRVSCGWAVSWPPRRATEPCPALRRPWMVPSCGRVAVVMA